MSALSRYKCLSHVTCGSWLGLSSFDSWRRSWPRWHPLRRWSLTDCSPSWSRPRCLPAALLQPRTRSRSPLPKAAPGRSVSVGTLVCPTRAARQLLPTDRSPPPVALAPRPLPLAALSFGARPVRPMPPLRPGVASRLQTPVRLPCLSVPQAPLRHGEIWRQDFACLSMWACLLRRFIIR